LQSIPRCGLCQVTPLATHETLGFCNTFQARLTRLQPICSRQRMLLSLSIVYNTLQLSRESRKKIPHFSISGGRRDMLVHGGISLCDVAHQEDLQKQQQQQQEDMCISVGTPGMSGVGLTVDHDAAMWCNQARPPRSFLFEPTLCSFLFGPTLCVQLVLRLRSLLFHSLHSATGEANHYCCHHHCYDDIQCHLMSF
jgi:hypothetical protein